MDSLQIVVLALLQGLTEFLPVSSSAHLILPSQLLGWSDQGLAFDVAVHLGTLLAVVTFFRRDIWSMFTAWLSSLKGQQSAEGKLAWLIIAATVPAVVAGVLFSSFIDTHARSILVIAGTTLIFGALLWWVDENRTEQKSLKELGWKQGVMIGFAQALALIPGTSRSGVTITAALWLGFDRQSAARFSFLLSIPVIAGAGVFKGVELIQQATPVDWASLVQGTLLSALSAFLCIHLFLKLLDRIGMKPFVIYRMLLGVLLLFVYMAG